MATMVIHEGGDEAHRKTYKVRHKRKCGFQRSRLLVDHHGTAMMKENSAAWRLMPTSMPPRWWRRSGRNRARVPGTGTGRCRRPVCS